MSTRPRRYERFRDQVVVASLAYERNLDERHLREIASLFEYAGRPAGQVREIRHFVYDGWARAGYRPSRRRLARRNPDFRIHVARLPRSDVGRRGILFRYGFRVHAVAREHRTFDFFLSDRRGHDVQPTASSDSTARRLRLTGATPAAPTDPVAGYVDEVRALPAFVARDPTTWVSTLIHEIPERLLDFAESDQGAPWRDLIADELAASPISDRWADRFRLTSSGATGPFRSDLTLLHVDRAIPIDPSPARAALRPRLIREGTLVRADVDGTGLPAPDGRWLTLRDARVQDGGIVTVGDTLVLYEDSADPARGFVSGIWRTTFGSRTHPEAVLLCHAPEAPGVLPEGILLAGRSDFNWFHWFVEYLPRALTIPEAVPHDVPLLVTHRVPATGLEALAELSTRPIVQIDPDASQQVRVLHVAAPPVQVIDSPRVPWEEGLSIARGALETLRATWSLDRSHTKPTRKVFLERRSRHRGVLNERQLARIAVSAGFEVVDPSALSFAEQRELFGSTALLAGASGAAMANYLLLRPGSRILALTSPQLAGFILPAALAEVAGAEFTYLLGESALDLAEARDRNEWMHADFAIDPREFRAALELLER